jgi:hypothetical protein
MFSKVVELQISRILALLNFIIDIEDNYAVVIS